MLKATIPAWMNDLPDHALIDSSGVCAIFGICMQSIGRSIARETLPPPDRLGRLRNGGRVKYWRLGKLRSYVKGIPNGPLP